jgi:hypothetical protein
MGFAAGYYLGARAGRERYEQINKALRSLAESPVAHTAAEKAKEALAAGVGRARTFAGGRGADGQSGDITPQI